METANVMVAIGGDTGNTVAKYVTAAEIAVLRSIHGAESVSEIDPQADIERPSRAELARLKAIYGKATDGNQNSIVDQLYPGAAAPIFTTLDSLELDESFYKAATRVSRKPKKAVAQEMPEGLNKKQQAAWLKEQKAKADEAAEAELEDDGIEEMPDANVLG